MELADKNVRAVARRTQKRATLIDMRKKHGETCDSRVLTAKERQHYEKQRAWQMAEYAARVRTAGLLSVALRPATSAVEPEVPQPRAMTLSEVVEREVEVINLSGEDEAAVAVRELENIMAAEDRQREVEAVVEPEAVVELEVEIRELTVRAEPGRGRWGL